MPPPIIANTAHSHICLRVTDVPRAIEWYGAVLGYEVLHDGRAPTPDKTRNAIGLIGAGTIALEFLETPNGKKHDIETLGVAGISITVPDVDAAVAAYNTSGRGQTQAWPAEDWRVAFLFDPDGNVVELVQQPPGCATMANFAPTMRARLSA